MKVLILILLQDAKKCGGEVINFTIQRLFKESRVKHSETLRLETNSTYQKSELASWSGFCKNEK